MANQQPGYWLNARSVPNQLSADCRKMHSPKRVSQLAKATLQATGLLGPDPPVPMRRRFAPNVSLFQSPAHTFIYFRYPPLAPCPRPRIYEP